MDLKELNERLQTARAARQPSVTFQGVCPRARYERASGAPWRALVAPCLGVEVGTADTEEAAVELIQERLEALVGVDPFEAYALRRGSNAWWNQ